MKTLELKLDIEKLFLAEEDKKKPANVIVTEVIKTVIIGYSQQNKGLNQPERKQYYKLVDSLDKAITDKQESVELEDNEFGFIKKCFSESKLTPNNLLRQVEELLLNIKER